jgi:Skp family chaperone for outer membrane proteins
MRVASWFPLAVLMGWIGADMADGTTASSASAVIVAVVDIEEVIGGLEQRADAERKLQARAAEIQAEGDAWKSRLSEAEQVMQTAEGSEAQREAIVAFKDLEFRYEAKMAYWNDILERERVKLWQSVFATLREEVRKISEARGWDVVVADDSSAEFFPSREASLEAQYKQFMRNRRVLYAGQPVDATAIILDQMNRSWAAGPQGE